MQQECKFAGFGGQGIMTIGKLLALTGLEHGNEVVWLPSYGPEMRGGTAYCTVVIADKPVSSPVINSPTHLLVMNRPSLEKFQDSVKPGGCIVINSSLISITCERDDVDVLRVPCNEIAIELGNPRTASMIALGAFAERAGMIDFDELKRVVKEQFRHKPAIIDINMTALDRGAQIARDTAQFVPPSPVTGS